MKAAHWTTVDSEGDRHACSCKCGWTDTAPTRALGVQVCQRHQAENGYRPRTKPAPTPRPRPRAARPRSSPPPFMPDSELPNARARIRKLEADVTDLNKKLLKALAAQAAAEFKAATARSSGYGRPQASGAIYDDKVGKLLNKAVGTDSESEANLAFEKARALYRKARVA